MDALEFKKQLFTFIQFRGIDIVLYLRDGRTLELDKNRSVEGDIVINTPRDGDQMVIHINEILKADFYAA